VRIGLQIPSFTWPGGDEEIGPKLAEIGRTADEADFASLWVMDHFFQIGVIGEPEDPMLEGYSALSYLAGVTERGWCFADRAWRWSPACGRWSSGPQDRSLSN
jgi:hypothetical protein